MTRRETPAAQAVDVIAGSRDCWFRRSALPGFESRPLRDLTHESYSVLVGFLVSAANLLPRRASFAQHREDPEVRIKFASAFSTGVGTSRQCRLVHQLVAHARDEPPRVHAGYAELGIAATALVSRHLSRRARCDVSRAGRACRPDEEGAMTDTDLLRHGQGAQHLLPHAQLQLHVLEGVGRATLGCDVQICKLDVRQRVPIRKQGRSVA